MNGDVQVLGNVEPSHFLEDIRVTIPNRQIVSIPRDSIARSRDYDDAVGKKQLIPIMGVLPKGAVFPTGGRGAVQRAGAVTGRSPASNAAEQALRQENAALQREIGQLREQNAALQNSNGSLQVTLGVLSDQMKGLHRLMSELKAQGIQVTGMPLAGVTTPSGDEIDGTAPVFVASDIVPKDAKVSVKVKQREGGAVSDAQAALKSLRGKK